MKRELGILLVAAGLVVGCGGKNNTCVPGTSSACACSDGSAGAQVCAGDGTYGACECGGGTGGNAMGGGGGSSSNGGGGSGGGGGGSTSAGPISIANPSARSMGNGYYTISFVIDDAGVQAQRYLERLDLVRLTWGATTVSVNPQCATLPWSTDSPVSDVITIGFTVNATGGTSVLVPCGSNGTPVDGGGGATMPSTAISLDFEGIMTDAAPFKATASAPIL